MKMLRSLSLLSRRKNLLNLIVLLSLISISSYTYGIDTLGLGVIDSQSTTKMIPADSVPENEFRSGITIQGRQDGLSKKSILDDEISEKEDPYYLDSAYRGSVVFGYGVLRNLDLNLGVHFTYEDVDPTARDGLSEKASTDEMKLSWRGHVKDNAFSGASLALKYKLVDWEDLKLSLVPFIESGVGNRGRYALTRSDNALGGIVAAASYGRSDAGELAVNIGYRYGKSQELGDVILGNEMFYRTSLTGYVSKTFGVFVMSDARNIAVKPKEENSDKKGKTSSDLGFGGGLVASIDSAKVSAYYLVGVKKESVGGFKNEAGLGVSFPIGKVSKKVKDESEENAELAANNKVKKEPDLRALYPEMYTDSIDLSDLDGVKTKGGKDDDFDIISRKMAEKEKARKAGYISDDEKMEQELVKMREADRRLQKEQEKQERAQAKLREKQEREQWKQEEIKMKKARKTAKAKAAKLPYGITDDEVNWGGLE